MKKILNVVGARPNFMKIAPIHKKMLTMSGYAPVLVHTGQHYDEAMSRVFFEDLELPEPDAYLGIGSGSHGEQTARLLEGLERVMLAERPALVVVVGDVNSTMAAAIDAAKLGIPVAHIEAGLRSFDRSMPEEINRIVTDALAEYLFVTEVSATQNLLREGARSDRVYFVGNVMIDTLLAHRDKAMASNVLQVLGLEPKGYVLVTLHRPSNVDTREGLALILDALEQIQRATRVVFPVHPRTRKMLDHHGFGARLAAMKNLELIEPQGYLEFLRLMSGAQAVVTDSGGIQEETTVLGVPCITVRTTTERPVTVTTGTNVLVAMDPDRIVAVTRQALGGQGKQGDIPPLWDGHAADRICAVLAQVL
ncbi:MAG: non-hydrolyzing UDP-N-acetylglucosamine 2-epimerase [Gammaproteobacteria bacterium]